MKLVLFSISSSYFSAVFLVWVVARVAKHAPVHSIGKVWQIFKPLLISLLIGVFPGGLLTLILIEIFSFVGFVAMIPQISGMIVSATFLHQDLLSDVQQYRKWNSAIFFMTLAANIFNLWVFSQFSEHIV